MRKVSFLTSQLLRQLVGLLTVPQMGEKVFLNHESLQRQSRKYKKVTNNYLSLTSQRESLLFRTSQSNIIKLMNQDLMRLMLLKSSAFSAPHTQSYHVQNSANVPGKACSPAGGSPAGAPAACRASPCSQARLQCRLPIPDTVKGHLFLFIPTNVSFICKLKLNFTASSFSTSQFWICNFSNASIPFTQIHIHIYIYNFQPNKIRLVSCGKLSITQVSFTSIQTLTNEDKCKHKMGAPLRGQHHGANRGTRQLGESVQLVP